MAERTWHLVGLSEVAAVKWRSVKERRDEAWFDSWEAVDLFDEALRGGARLVSVEGVERGPAMLGVARACSSSVRDADGSMWHNVVNQDGDSVAVDCGSHQVAIVHRVNNWDALADQLDAARAEVAALREELGYLRPEVRAFARAMEEKLRENDHKPGWKNDSDRSLLGRAYEELEELREECSALSIDDGGRGMRLRTPHTILGEAADVANMVMMVADVRGGLDGGNHE